MAMNSISTNTPTVHIDLLPSGKAVVSSKEVALRFQKKHNDVLRDINRIRSMVPKSFTERNFAPSEYTDSTGRTLPAFNLTRDAFSLLAMGFTGKAAVLWKLKYLEAFNTLEQYALQQAHTQGLQLGSAAEKRMTAARRTLARKALSYKAKGLGNTEISKLINVKPHSVWRLLDDARTLGMGV